MTATRATEAERRAIEAERRVEMLIELVQRQDKTNARLEEMMQAIAALNLQHQKTHTKDEPGEEDNRGGDNGGENLVIKSDWGRSTRYEFPTHTKDEPGEEDDGGGDNGGGNLVIKSDWGRSTWYEFPTHTKDEPGEEDNEGGDNGGRNLVIKSDWGRLTWYEFPTHTKDEPGEEDNGGGDNGGGNLVIKSDWGRLTRYEFPKFDGDGFEGWVMRSEYLFEVASVPEVEKVRVAALHLDGRALQWHRGLVSLHGENAYQNWGDYIKALSARFGAYAYEDPLSDLRNLKQVSSFEELYPRTGIGELYPRTGIGECSRGGEDAYALAKLQELTVKALDGKTKVSSSGYQNTSGYSSNNRSLAVTATNLKPVTGSGVNNGNVMAKPRPRLTSKELEDRRSRGLGYWCAEKYSPNHRCPNRRAFAIQMLDDGSEEGLEGQGEEEEEAEAEVAAELQLSLHAMWGLEGSKIMRIRGICQKKPLRILIDTSSTHNFLSAQMAEKVRCKWLQVKLAAVEVANGQQLDCTGKCKDFEWEIQGTKFKTEVHIIGLGTYDLILGVQWLSTLGDIAWNFKKGVDNAVADALSRISEGENESGNAELSLYALISYMIPLELISQIKASWENDAHLQKVIQEKEVNSSSHTKFSWSRGELRRKAGHFGALDTYKMIAAMIYWPKMTPFEALYGYPPPLHIPYLPGDSSIAAVDLLLCDRKEQIQLLKANLQRASDRMKKQTDKHRVDRQFAVGDWVLLKLQAYRQRSVKGTHHKFESKFFGPYQVLDRIVPQAVIDRRMVKCHNRAVEQWLIHWAGRSPAGAPWEYAEEITTCFLMFLEDKEP